MGSRFHALALVPGLARNEGSTLGQSWRCGGAVRFNAAAMLESARRTLHALPAEGGAI